MERKLIATDLGNTYAEALKESGKEASYEDLLNIRLEQQLAQLIALNNREAGEGVYYPQEEELLLSELEETHRELLLVSESYVTGGLAGSVLGIIGRE